MLIWEPGLGVHALTVDAKLGLFLSRTGVNRRRPRSVSLPSILDRPTRLSSQSLSRNLNAGKAPPKNVLRERKNKKNVSEARCRMLGGGTSQSIEVQQKNKEVRTEQKKIDPSVKG